MKSVMQHNFAHIEPTRAPRSRFDRSCGHKTGFDAGYLIPFYVDETVPGDTFKMDSTIFARMSTPLKPIMDNLHMECFFFDVPLRLVWDNFQKFMGERIDPDDSIDYTIPQMVSPVGGYQPGSLEDHFGLPTFVAGLSHSALVHRAHATIYNAWFRDQNLIDSIPVSRGDGPDLSTSYQIHKRGKRFDYFTSCLPAPQKGDAISLPLGTRAPVYGIGKDNQTYSQTNTNVYETAAASTTNYADSHLTSTTSIHIEEDPDNAGFPGIYADLSAATAATIDALNLSIQLQAMLQRDARAGTRYVEILQSHFGVFSPDQRLQRPEFIGGGSVPININPIAQQSESGTTPLASLAAVGTASGNCQFTKSFTEHSIVIGYVCVRADLTYQQGLDRMWSRLTRYNFYWPLLAHLGEQAVANREIYAQGTPDDVGVLGYQERWAEMRYKNSQITGVFRSNHPQSLDVYHLSQDYSSLPVLNQTFIEENVPMDRIVAVPSEPHFLFDSYQSLQCVRPLPIYSTPQIGARL